MPTLFLITALGMAVADEKFEAPREHRPDNFRDAVGLFRIQAGAKPTSVPVQQPILYTVRITADNSVPMHSPPLRPELEKAPGFTDFVVETPEPASKKDGNVWEFYYLLKPKSE